MSSSSAGASYTQLSFPFLESMTPTRKRWNLRGVSERVAALEFERLRETAYRETMARFQRAADARRRAFSDAEMEGAVCRVDRVILTRKGGCWEVLAKGNHDSKGPVYRYGYIISALELGELLMRWNRKDDWTKDKHRK